MLGSFEEEEGREGEKPGWSRWGRRGRGRRVRTPPPSAPATTSDDAGPPPWLLCSLALRGGVRPRYGSASTDHRGLGSRWREAKWDAGGGERSDEGPGLLPSSSRSPRRPTRHDAGKGERRGGRRGERADRSTCGGGADRSTWLKLTVVRWALTRGLAGPGS